MTPDLKTVLAWLAAAFFFFALAADASAATPRVHHQIPKNHVEMNWPLPPTNLKIEAVSAKAVTISWQPSKSPNVANYLIYESGVLIATVSGTTVSFTDQDVRPGRTYEYSIKSQDPSGQIGAAAFNPKP
jgi:Fibronectin type III domain